MAAGLRPRRFFYALGAECTSEGTSAADTIVNQLFTVMFKLALTIL
jgi:hypothetical protein